MYRWGSVLVAGLLTAAAAAAAAEELPPPQVSAVPIPDGQIARAVEAVDGLVANVMQRSGIPGVAVAVVSGGEVLLAKGYGLREVGRPEPVDADTVFQLASVSKSLGGTVVATQVSAGRLDWDDRIAAIMPWFRLSDPDATALLTVADLYAHRSGLPDHAGDDLEDIGYDRRQVLERLALVPLDGFRDRYAYTNFGMTAGAEAVAAAVGTDWETLSEQALYAPLGMTRTSSRFADFIARSNRAVPHMRAGDGWQPLAQRDPDPQSPAGGVSSTVTDMAKWLAMVLADGGGGTEPLIRPEVMLQVVSPHAVASPPYAPDARPNFYGYGIEIGTSPSGRVIFSHSGAFNLGAATTYLMIPSAETGIVVLSNAQPIGAVEAIQLAFSDLVQFGTVTRDWFEVIQPLIAPLYLPAGHLAETPPPADPAPARDLGDYAGRYENGYVGPVGIAVEGDGLVMTAGPAAERFALRHWSGDSFVFEPRGENAMPGSLWEVRFAAGAGPAGDMTVELWNEYGLGGFERVD